MGGGENDSQIQIIFKEEHTGFRDGFDVCCEEEKSNMIFDYYEYCLVLYGKTLLPLYIEILTPSSLRIVVCRPRVSAGIIS